MSYRMSKIFVKAKLWNILDEKEVQNGKKEPLNLETVVDTEATLVVIPEDIARQLKLLVGKKVSVRYADGRVEARQKFLGLRLEILGRDATIDVITEPNSKEVLIGHEVLEEMDLIVDPKEAKLLPRQGSPDITIIDLL